MVLGLCLVFIAILAYIREGIIGYFVEPLVIEGKEFEESQLRRSIN